MFGRFFMVHRTRTVIVGIDLAGSSRRPTGICILRGMKASTQLAFDDEEILSAVDQAKPNLVPIDAPLSLPNGRKTIHERSGAHLRECDRELQRRRIRFFPITLGPMRNQRPTSAAVTASSSSLVIFLVNPLTPRFLSPRKSPLRSWC